MTVKLRTNVLSHTHIHRTTFAISTLSQSSNYTICKPSVLQVKVNTNICSVFISISKIIRILQSKAECLSTILFGNSQVQRESKPCVCTQGVIKLCLRGRARQHHKSLRSIPRPKQVTQTILERQLSWLLIDTCRTEISEREVWRQSRVRTCGDSLWQVVHISLPVHINFCLCSGIG